jgi:hypothetical protein
MGCRCGLEISPQVAPSTTCQYLPFIISTGAGCKSSELISANKRLFAYFFVFFWHLKKWAISMLSPDPCHRDCHQKIFTKWLQTEDSKQFLNIWLAHQLLLLHFLKVGYSLIQQSVQSPPMTSSSFPLLDPP